METTPRPAQTAADIETELRAEFEAELPAEIERRMRTRRQLAAVTAKWDALLAAFPAPRKAVC
jgi:hypothetical protein